VTSWTSGRGLSRLAGAFAVAILATSADPTAAAAARDRNVLLLYDERTELPGLDTLDESLVQTLRSRSRDHIEVFREAMDLSRFDSNTYEPLLRDHIEAKYATRRIDVVVAVMGPALDFLLDHGDTLFPTTPIVFCGIDERELGSRRLPHRVTGVLVRREFAPTLELALRIHPETLDVVFVGGSSDFDQRLVEQARDELRPFERRVRIRYLVDEPLDDLLSELARLPPRTLVLCSTVFQDGAGEPYLPHEVTERITREAPVPAYGFVDQFVGRGIVGGHVYSIDVHGEEAAELVLRILSGTDPGMLPYVTGGANVDLFDWRALRRWGIDEALLPEGSTVRFREVNLWELHRDTIIAGFILLLGQAFLIGTLLVERKNRKGAESRVREAEQRYRTVADFTHDWEYWRTPEQTFAWISPSCLRLTGYGAEEFRSRPSLLNDIVVPEDRGRWVEHARLALQGPGAPPLEMRIRRGDGEIRWIDHVCTRVSDGDGRFLGIRGSNRDVTDKKRSQEQLQTALAEIERLRERLVADNVYLREQIEPAPGFEGIIGTSDALGRVLARVHQVAPTPSTVLILGETGVGKDLVAHALHSLSPRGSRPLIKLDCAALPASIVESELFGHEKGAFTNAVALRKGRFEIADGSTLFLDEIGELSLELQAKLLRVIQDGEFERVGGSRTLRVDVRLIAATNRRLQEDVQAGRFREDLWYRLNVFPITIPPLRERLEDIPLLVLHFVEKHCRRQNRPVLQVSQATLRDLQGHAWPGNVRELESVIERAVISSAGTVLRVGEDRSRPTIPRAARADEPGSRQPGKTLTDIEREHIVAALERALWQVEGEGGAAASLGVNPSTLRSRMRKLGIRRPRTRYPPGLTGVEEFPAE